MFFKIIIIFFMLLASLYGAKIHHEYIKKQAESSAFIAYFCNSLEANAKTKMLPICTVFENCLQEKSKTTAVFSSFEELQNHILLLPLDAGYLKNVNEMLRDLSNCSSSESVTLTANLSKLSLEEEEKYSKKLASNEKTIYIIYPLIVLCLSIMMV